MLSYTQCRDIINEEIKSLSFSGHPKELYEPVEYMMKLGGKRIRPAMCLMACSLFEGEIQKAIRPAIGLEIFHNFSLVHDDIMDEADLRRGNPTVHKKWNQTIGILSGDLMEILATEFIAQVDARYLKQSLNVYFTLSKKVCEGQQLDMNFENVSTVTETEYIDMISKKTAALLAGSMQLGALLADAGKDSEKRIHDFAENLGIAFQLRDDYLDSFGDSEFGKKIGGDILADKKTILMVKLLESESADEAFDIIKNVNNINSEEKIKTIKELYNREGIDRYVLSQIDEYYNKALQNLEDLKIDKSKLEPVYELAAYIMNRDV